MSQRTPSLKLKPPTAQVPKQEPQDSPPPATPASSTKIKLKFGKKGTSQTPAPQPPSDAGPAPTTKPKPARKSKPTPKKRALEEEPELQSPDEDPSVSAPASVPKPKKIKFTSHGHSPAPAASGRVLLRTKTKGQIPRRPHGVGYDSEASDREDDPMISESIILRMAPGPDCDYLRAAVTSGSFGMTKDGGADVRIRFLRSDGRRAVITIRKQIYAAILVDLPCIIEAMKSWFPKNGWMKSADICQMLMVLGSITKEEDAVDYPLPLAKGELDEKTWQWAHGITPPMHWVRKRRFRKRISVRTVMEVEAEVEELLRRDEECEGEPKIEIIDRADQGSEAPSEDLYGEDEDAEGDLDDQDQQAETPLDTIEGEDEDAENARMAELFERQMMANDDAEHDGTQPLTSTGPSFESPAGLDTASTPPSLAATPSAIVTPSPAVDTSSAADDDEDQEESSDEDEADEDQVERQQEMQKLKEEVEDLEAAIKGEKAKLEVTNNKMLRKRLEDKIQGLQGDLELKIKAMEGANT